MSEAIEKKTNYFYIIGIVYLCLTFAFMFSERLVCVLSIENCMDVLNTFVDNESYNVPVNNDLSSIYNRQLLSVRTPVRVVVDASGDRGRSNNRISYINNSTNNQQYRNAGSESSNVNCQSFDQIENTNQQNNNSGQLNANSPNLSINGDISWVFSTVFKRNNDANDGSLDNVTSLKSGFLVSEISLNENNIETDTYQQAGIDPSGDPEGAPIPVGDGSWLLFVIAIFYVGWKSNRINCHI